MKKKIFFIIEFLSVAAIFGQKSNQIQIPFTMDRNLIIIKAKLTNIGTQNFVFDTGTEGIMLIDSLASQYKISGQDTIETPKGEIRTLEKVLIPEIVFDGLALKNKNAIKMPQQMLFSNKAVGIIGMQTFLGYMMTLDYKNNKIILEKGSLIGKPNIIPINLDHILEANVKLNNKEVLAHFDCGGAGYISVPKGWDSTYKIKGEPVLMGKGRTPMGDFDVYKADLDGDIDIGNYKISNPKINLVTGDFFYGINFGYGFFKEHLITIDTKNKLMQIKS